jgi:hypothetical protein
VKIQNIGNSAVSYNMSSRGSEVPLQHPELFLQEDKVVISEEGYQRSQIYLANQKSGKTSPTYEEIMKERELLSKIVMDVAGRYYSEMSHIEKGTIADLKDKKGTYDLSDVTQAKLDAYSKIYDQIKKGYADGTREIWVSENGSRHRLTEEEDLEYLNRAYDRSIRDVQGFAYCQATRAWTQGKIDTDSLRETEDSQKLEEAMKDAQEHFHKQYARYKNDKDMASEVKNTMSYFLKKDTEFWSSMRNIFDNITVSVLS